MPLISFVLQGSVEMKNYYFDLNKKACPTDSLAYTHTYKHTYVQSYTKMGSKDCFFSVSHFYFSVHCVSSSF